MSEKDGYPDRLPNEGEIVNGWSISVSVTGSMALNSRLFKKDLAKWSSAIFHCVKGNRAIMFAVLDEIIVGAKQGGKTEINLFWRAFDNATSPTERYVAIRSNASKRYRKLMKSSKGIDEPSGPLCGKSVEHED